MSILRRAITRVLHSNDDEGGTINPTEVNRRQNNARVDRMAAIADRVDGARADDMDDIEGEEVVGRFRAGELDDSPEAVERRAAEEDEAARQALEEEAERQRALELQAEGAGDADDTADLSRRSAGDDAPEEKVINGVKHYLLVINGKEKWLTFPQLRAQAQKVESADEALQRANDAVKKATQLALAPREVPNDEDEGNDVDVESVLSSAVMGDREAIKSLATLLKRKPSKTLDVSREVANAIATRSAVIEAEAQQKDIFSVPALVPIFKARLTAVANEEPDLQIQAAYKKAGDIVRREFAPMLKANPNAPRSKAERKRELVNPPAQAARQAPREDESGEENPTSVIDQIAKSRGQARAIRHGRNLSSG